MGFFFPFFFFSALRESVDQGWAFYFVKVQKQSTAPRPALSPAPPQPTSCSQSRSWQIWGAIPDQSYIFFFTARSDAPDLLSDVAWMIQTKQMPSSLKIEVKRLNVCT